MGVCVCVANDDRRPHPCPAVDGVGRACGGHEDCEWGVWVTSVLSTGVVFPCLDVGDPLHASVVALHDLHDPFRFLTP